MFVTFELLKVGRYELLSQNVTTMDFTWQINIGLISGLLCNLYDNVVELVVEQEHLDRWGSSNVLQVIDMALDYLRECVIHENLLLLIIFLCNDVVLKKLAISSLYVPKHVAQYLSTYFASVVRMQTCDESVRDQLRTHCSTVGTHKLPSFYQ